MDLTTSDEASPKLPPEAISNFRSTLQKIAYARDGRPDMDFAVSFLQGKQSSPSEQDAKDLTHLLGYLKKFPEKNIIFKPKDMQFRGYADAAYNITNDGRSHYGYAISLGYSLISTKGGRIKTVVRSSTEAEISAVNEIASDILWCRDVLEELGYKQDPIPIMEDNKSCITMLQTELRNFHSKSRHVSKVGVLQRGVCQEDHLPTLLPNRQHGSRLVNKTSWYQSSQPPRDCNSQRF